MSMYEPMHETSGTEEAHSPPPPAHTDSHTEVQSEPSFMPLIYPTMDEWRTTIPRTLIESMTLEEQHDAYQRMIELLTRISDREMPVGDSPLVQFPRHTIVPFSGRPMDVVRATVDFVDTQDMRHDLRISECRLAKLERHPAASPEELAAESGKVSRLQELLRDASEHFDQQGLRPTVQFKEFLVMTEWKDALEVALREDVIMEAFSGKEEMHDVLSRLDKSIANREQQLYETGILPLAQAPQTARRLAVGILASQVGGGVGELADERNGLTPSRKETSRPSSKRISDSGGSIDADTLGGSETIFSRPRKKIKTEPVTG